MNKLYWLFPFLLFGVSPLFAQVVNPADKQKKEKEQGEEIWPAHSWELPPIVIPGQPLPELREEERVGSYGQPRWTTQRLFTNTRLYVIPEGQAEFEYWMIPEVTRNGDNEVQRMYEFEFGLGNRFQLDLYAVSDEVAGDAGTLEFDQHKVELRYAFADWDKIWGNPTAYLEWVARDQKADKVEVKLLLGGEMCSGWHWGANLVLEQTTGDTRETERQITFGVSHTVIDERFSCGMEGKFSWIDENTDRGHFTREYFLGPTFQFRPIKRAHLDVAPLWGLNQDTSHLKAYVVFGWEF